METSSKPFIQETSRPSILIVEDEFILGNELRQMLIQLNYEVQELVFSEAEAHTEIRKQPPDLVLLDIVLDDSHSGILLAEALQKEYHIPFIFTTSYAKQDILNAAKETHPYGYLLKPIRPSALRAAIEIALHRAAYNRLAQHHEQLQHEKRYLEDELKTVHNFGEMIGRSPAIKEIFQQISQVAPTSTTVLIQGETGTGKELVARAIHSLSPRKNRPLVKINCAALPSELIESELFGHEKGSFTGALHTRKGKFELAHEGTIFLDEIGELPLSLQSKLLRVLQEQEIERLGSNKTSKVDMRILAATNRNLNREVADGKFRSDLFYRLNVFPLMLPPLRERKSDIPLLTEYFLKKNARQFGKKIKAVSKNTLMTFNQYHWPGNVRELAHVIEREVIRSNGATLVVDSPDTLLPSSVESSPSAEIKTLKETERDLIMRALQRSGGKIRGKNGAANMLDINPTTLESRMVKLGIKKKHVIS